MPTQIIPPSYNEHFIKTLRWDGKDQRISIGDCLFLQVRKSSKTWLVRRRLSGKTSVTTIGKHPDLSLKNARVKAMKIVMASTVSVFTVEQLVTKYMQEVVELKHKRPDLAQGYMDRAVLPTIGTQKVRDITRAQLVKLIQDYSKRGARTADQLRSNLKKLFSYAVELGHRDDNPMLDVTSRITGYIPKSRDRVLSDDEIKDMWTWKNNPQGWQRTEDNTRILRFLLLTGLRINEARNGYQVGDKWIVPKEISKNGNAHWVYLTETAKQQLPLPSCTTTNIQAWLKRRLGLDNDNRYTPHDLRRTCATRMADNGIEPFIVERVLNHKLEGVMAVYNRAEYEAERIKAALVMEKILIGITYASK
ncbi:integrase family protein [uncultured Cycloclasticus sp.]|uniref:tyrosine-type recombinase/integrase n=1 Tax=uncultured Cycloclasticus sp. TaxID=172194 RepID=UPI00258F597E|nr:integrase family protein [uncultured Cycloclasticus sp.]